MNILLVDDHKLMRDGLRVLLEREGLKIAGEAATGLEAVGMARCIRPDLVIMDISMPGMNGIDCTRRLLAELPQTKVIGLSMNADRRYVAALFEAGGHGYVLKNSASEELIQACWDVMAGRRHVSSAIGPVSMETTTDSGVAKEPKIPRTLSPREREVLRLIAEGKSSKDVASELGIALPTVETHRRQIMGKLQLRTIAELTKYAIREGLTSVG